jgi:ankyrin repeat protein
VLLENGAFAHKPNVDGVTPLHDPANKGHLAIVWLLVENGAIVHAQDAGRHTSSYYAERAGHAAVASFLRKTAGEQHPACDHICAVLCIMLVLGGKCVTTHITLFYYDKKDINFSIAKCFGIRDQLQFHGHDSRGGSREIGAFNCFNRVMEVEGSVVMA